MNLRPEGGTHHLSMSMLPVAYWRHQSRDHPPWVEAIPQPGFSTIRTPPSPPLNKLKLSNSTRNILNLAAPRAATAHARTLAELE